MTKLDYKNRKKKQFEFEEDFFAIFSNIIYPTTNKILII